MRVDRAGIAMVALMASTASAQPGEHAWSLAFDLSSPAASTGLESWVDGSIGKLRYDEADAALDVGRISFEYDGRIGPRFTAHVVADLVDDASNGLDVTEAYVDWRPVPTSANRHRVRVGAFYPPMSLENGGPGWTSPYTFSPSAINTWIAEEVRTLGAEWRMSRPLGLPASDRELTVLAAAYYGNDPAGVLLVWKGWSIHDRQSRLDDSLALPALPQLGPGTMFEKQALGTEPFRETDDRPGFYLGAEWRLSRRALLSAMHYDNHADPMSLRDGHYGWTTRFDHVGAQLELPSDFGLVAQWMEGTTAMGPLMPDGAHPVDAGFQAWFLLLTRAIERHRVSLRYDDFEVVDNDSTPLDANGETGDAWTLAYRYDHSERLSFGFEWLEIETTRPAWAYFGLPVRASERLVQARMTFRLGSAAD